MTFLPAGMSESLDREIHGAMCSIMQIACMRRDGIGEIYIGIVTGVETSVVTLRCNQVECDIPREAIEAWRFGVSPPMQASEAFRGYRVIK